MAAPEWPKSIDYIPIGGEWTWPLAVTSEDGAALVAAGVTAARAEIRDSYADAAAGADPLLVLTTAAGADGTITLTDIDSVWTELALYLPATATAGLSTPNPASGRVRVVIGDVEVWNPSTPAKRYRVCDFRLYLRPNSTIG